MDTLPAAWSVNLLLNLLACSREACDWLDEDDDEGGDKRIGSKKQGGGEKKKGGKSGRRQFVTEMRNIDNRIKNNMDYVNREKES